MSIAETAELAVNLHLGTTGSFKTATSELSGMEAAAARGALGTGTLSRGFSAASGAAGKFGGALGHAKGQLVGLLTGPLGIIGLTGGLFSLGGIFESSIRHASDMGFAVEKLTGLTGASATEMSRLLVTFEKFGISADKTAQIVGFTEKTLGKLADTAAPAASGQVSLAKAQDAVRVAAEKLKVAQQKLIETESKGSATASQLTAAHNRVTDAAHKLAEANAILAASTNAPSVGLNKLQALQTKFGLALTDAAGRALPFSVVLNNVADYYNSNAQASDKAYVAATLLGRGYAQLIPLLKLGGQGIRDAEQAAADLGLTLTTQNAAELKDYRQNIRDVGEAIGGLQLQIGLALIPEVNKLAKGLTSFLEHGGTQQITRFFKDAAQFADSFGTAVHDTVLPVFGAIAAAWGSVPDDLKKLLIGGFVVNKASKFLFDFGIKDAAGGLKGLIEGVLGRVPGARNVVGALDPGMRVFVTNFPLGFGGGGGLPNVLPGVAAGAGVAVTAATIAAGFIAILGLPLLAAWAADHNIAGFHKGDVPSRAAAIGGGNGPTFDFAHGFATGGPQDSPLGRIAPNIDRALDGPLGRMTAKVVAALRDNRAAAKEDAARLNAEFRGVTHALTGAKGDTAIAKALKAAMDEIFGKGKGGSGGAQNILTALRSQLLVTHDPKLQAALREAIGRVEHIIPARELIEAQLSKADAIWKSNLTNAQKIVALQHIEEVIGTKNRTATKEIQAKIDAARRADVAAAHATAQAVKDKKLSVTVANNTTLNVSTRTIAAATATSQRIYSTVTRV